jgi:DNA invertase Pin-like site-specific DNA recombinase
MFSPDEILVYLRKSRSDDPILSVEEVLQKHETILNEWVEQHLSGAIPESNYYREVVSGESIDDRIEFQKLLKKIESPKIKAVLIVETQRLGRPDLEEIGRITKIFRFTNTMVITPQKTYDLQDEYDRDIFERELKRGNEYLEYQKKIMARGRLLSVSQGNYIASMPPYGYDKIWITEGKKKYPTLQENKEQADVIRLIFDMYVNKGVGVHLIAKHLDSLNIKPAKGKHWSPNALKDMLQNVHYIGKVKWNWRKTVTVIEDGEVIKSHPKSKMGDYLIYDGKHSAIISEDIFQAAQEKIGRNHRAKPTTKIRNPLAGLVYCKCGRAMSLRTYKKDGVERAEPRLLCDGQVNCGTGSCLYNEMLERVYDILERSITDFEIKLKNQSEDSVALHHKIIKNLEKRLAELEQKELAQWEAQADPNPENRMPPEIFKQLNAKVVKEKEETKKALLTAHETMPTPVDYQNRIYRFRDALEALRDDSVSAEKKNNLLKACIERIEYYRKPPERTKSQKVRYYDTMAKRTKTKSSLSTGGNWTTYPIEIDVKLKV